MWISAKNDVFGLAYTQTGDRIAKTGDKLAQFL